MTLHTSCQFYPVVRTMLSGIPSLLENSTNFTIRLVSKGNSGFSPCELLTQTREVTGF